MSITILNPGMLTSVQDLGRIGYQQYIKFYAIDQAEFDRIAALEASGGYTVHTYPRKEAEQA